MLMLKFGVIGIIFMKIILCAPYIPPMVVCIENLVMVFVPGTVGRLYNATTAIIIRMKYSNLKQIQKL